MARMERVENNIDRSYVPGYASSSRVLPNLDVHSIGGSPAPVFAAPYDVTPESRPIVTRPPTTSTVGSEHESDIWSRRSSPSTGASSSSPPSDFAAPFHTQLNNLPVAINQGSIGENYELRCDFVVTGCGRRFHSSNRVEWFAHTLSHFGGIPPPPKIICPFCDEPDTIFEFPEQRLSNWQTRMVHVEGHYRQGDLPLRPDFFFVDYLREHNLISQEDYVHAMAYTERPRCDGLVDLGTKTERARLREKRAQEVRTDTADEDRLRRREKKRGGRRH